MIPGSGDLQRHIIKDYLWRKKIFGEEFSYETCFFLCVNIERANRLCAK